MRRCFPALSFYVGLRLPVLFRVPFLASDLACLVCTVQIKVVSLTPIKNANGWSDGRPGRETTWKQCAIHWVRQQSESEAMAGFRFGPGLV